MSVTRYARTRSGTSAVTSNGVAKNSMTADSIAAESISYTVRSGVACAGDRITCTGWGVSGASGAVVSG
ncbi:hypothetical protein NWFMUON74_64120 [Nocardia wallacei]|uniref:Uncharacterized protein n=1 Tax=Nocardia wallacei TaxID=480035 RepID=A0A7G1KTW8_9NOCA|nr:hypothetical protein NWFMUON74_64120 [Nocardia wallacei]